MARSLLTGERATLTGSGYARHLKLEVQNGSGTWKNVGDLLGIDYVVGGGVAEEMDQSFGTASFRIRRRNGSTSLSPLVVSSVLNVDDDGFYSPLLEKGRAFRVWYATIPNGTLPASGDWRQGMEGRIDNVAWESDPIVIDCSDLGAWLADAQIKVDAVQYGTTPTGTPLVDALQAIIDDTPSGKLTTAQETIYVNTTNDFAVTNWLQSGNNKVLEGTRALVQQTTADDFRFRYDAAHVFRLTLFDPQRDRTTVDWTLGPEEYYPIRRLNSAIVDIRNSGEMAYVGGTVTSPAVPATDPSVLAYGERFFRLPSNDAITTELQAQTLLDIVVEDLNDGPLDQETALPMFWPVQLFDRITFTANSDHYDEDQTFMVAGYRHEFDGLGSATTTLRLGGKVVGAYADWIRGMRQRRSTIETYNQVLAKITASDSTTVTVTVTATSPAGTPTVEYVGVTGGASKLSGPAIGVPSASGTVWVFTRGTGSGVGQAEFKGTFPGNIDDTDLATIPAQGDTATVYLLSRARVIASDATTVTVRYAVADPFPPGGASVTVTYQNFGTGGVTPASGGTITPATTLTEAAGTYIDYTITKPAFGAGTGRVTFTASATSRVSDADSVTVPPSERDTVTPNLGVADGTKTATYIEYVVTGSNPTGGTPPILEGLIKGSGGSNMSSGATLVDGTVFTISDGETIRINRAAFDTTAQVSVTFFSTLGSAVTKIQRTIQNQVKASFGPSLVVTPTPGSSSYSLAYSGTYDTLVLSINGAAYGAPAASPITVTRSTSDITYSFKATKDAVDVVQTIVVPALSTATSLFSSLTNVIASYLADTVTFGWAWSGATATFDIYVREGATGPFYYDGTTASGATSYTFQSSYNLITTAGTNVDIAFYAVAQIGSTVAGTSAQKKSTYVQGGPH